VAFLVYETLDPLGEKIADDAANAAGVAAGFDEELSSVTFDSDAHDEDALRTVMSEAFAAIDSDWDSHLREAD
jgi:hypothetical protein